MKDAHPTVKAGEKKFCCSDANSCRPGHISLPR
jgi:hypothetical protein